jgi:hypothetical protein
MDIVRKLFGSRKFLVLLASSIALLITKYLKIQVDEDTVLQFVILIGGYLVGQGIADVGKGAAKVNAISALTSDSSVSASETKKAIEDVKSV